MLWDQATGVEVATGAAVVDLEAAAGTAHAVYRGDARMPAS